LFGVLFACVLVLLCCRCCWCRARARNGRRRRFGPVGAPVLAAGGLFGRRRLGVHARQSLIQCRPFAVLPSYSHARPASCSLARARNARPTSGNDTRTKAPERQTLRADLGRSVAVIGESVFWLFVLPAPAQGQPPGGRRNNTRQVLFAEIKVSALARRNHPVKIGFDLRELGSDRRTRVLVLP
jgi:hypothetical protein